jgi:hypothetical protein
MHDKAPWESRNVYNRDRDKDTDRDRDLKCLVITYTAEKTTTSV